MFLSRFIHDSQNLELVSFHRWIMVHWYHAIAMKRNELLIHTTCVLGLSHVQLFGRCILYHLEAQYTQQPEWIPRGLQSGKSRPQSFHSIWFRYITFLLKLIKLQKWRTESRRWWGGEEAAEKQASWWWLQEMFHVSIRDFLSEFFKMLPLEETEISTISYDGLQIFHFLKKSI